MSIPKIIHLCWYGRGKYPELTEKCILSWKKVLPDYEIKIWDEDSFDIACCSFTRQAYAARKWAFVSDYVRLVALYQYGGIYMDTDLEVLKDFSHLLKSKKFVTSYVEGGLVATSFIASEAGHPFLKKLIEYYDCESLKIESGESISYVMNPLIFTEMAKDLYGFSLRCDSFENDYITIYPIEYFMAYKKFNFGSSYAHWRYKITKNTCTIHHDMGSWHKRNPLKKFFADCARLFLPQKIYLSMKIQKNEAEILKREGL